MGKALFGSLYVHPPLSDAEVSELDERSTVSLKLHEERDSIRAWPKFDSSDADMKALVAKLRGWNKSVFMNAFVYSDSGGEGEEWLVIDDELQCHYFGSTPEYIKPWLSGSPPRITSRASLSEQQRLSARILRIAADLESESLVAELRELGETVVDVRSARDSLDELHGIACSDFEMSEAHWLEWRRRLGVLGVMVARVAFRPGLDVPFSDFEDFNLTQGWLSSHAPEIAAGIPPLFSAARDLERESACSFLQTCGRDLGLELE